MIRRRPPVLVSRRLAAVFGAVLAVCAAVLVLPLFGQDQDINEGDQAPRTLAAAHDAQYQSAAATDIARTAAAANVPPVAAPLGKDEQQKQSDRLDAFFAQVRIIRTATGEPQQRVTQIEALDPAQILTTAGKTALATLDNAHFDLLTQRAARALPAILAKPNTDVNATTARVEDYLNQLASKPGPDPASTSPDTQPELTGLKDVLRLFVIPNSIDNVQWQKNKDDARQNVAPIVKTYARGQVIVVEGDRITTEAVEALHATGVISDSFDVYDAAGGVLFAAGFGTALAVYCYLFQPFGAPAGRRMALVGLTVVAVLVGVRVAMPELVPDTSRHYFAYALPVAAAAIVAACIGDLALAAIVAVGVGLFATFIPATLPQLAGSSFVGSLQSFELAGVYIVSGLAGAAAIQRAERVSRFAVAASAAALGSSAVMAAFWLIELPRYNVDLGWIALAAAANGAAAAVMSLAVFVLLTLAFGVTTRLQLMELGQPDHPLLRRLQDEAPGTYHHSMMVGALAERGADRIGADAVVARVGAYYHDIGKLARPASFIENTSDGVPNPHDALGPAESAAIIRDHVTAGLDLARRHHLPPLIRDFIPQHHGTRLVTYFYRRAVQTGQRVDPAPFRYAGPRPQSKETAIVMLADSCEAVVRARQDEGAPGIDALVDGVFAERLAEGQLDDCDITMRELQQVAASFKATLRAVYHPRVPYPAPTPEELAGLARGDNLPARLPT